MAYCSNPNLAETVEAILLTGGASRRMGTDKAKLLVEGEPLGQRIARLLTERGIPVTVCGREPLAGYAFQEDEAELAGPLAAISLFEPTRELVFVASCDLVGFDSGVVDILADRIGGKEAAVPTDGERLQPLCALYRSSAFRKAAELAAQGEVRVMAWLRELEVVEVSGVPSEWIRNVNTPADL